MTNAPGPGSATTAVKHVPIGLPGSLVSQKLLLGVLKSPVISPSARLQIPIKRNLMALLKVIPAPSPSRNRL